MWPRRSILSPNCGDARITRDPRAPWLLALALALLLASAPARAAKWPDIPPEQMQLAQPIVDRQADAEALFWDIRAEDKFESGFTTELWHHLRIKVFTERGRETQSKVDLVYERGQQIDGISARCVAPDGKIVELAPGDVHERSLIKSGRAKVDVKSFVLPGVDVGSIVEYRWREFRGRSYRFRGLLELQRDIPIQRITYHVKPIQIRGAPPLASQAFHAVPTRFEPEDFGFYVSSINRVPAFVEEPDMPPEREVRMWMVMYYGEDASWEDVAHYLADRDDDVRREGHDLRSEAAKIVGDVQDPDERLRRIYRYCTTQVRNLENRAARLTPEERSRVRPNKTARVTLEAGEGTGGDVNRLFAALACGAGFDARITALGNREYLLFKERMLSWFLISSNVAVQVGGQWRFFDPAAPHVPFGMLRWQEEDEKVLLQDKREALWLNTPLSPASRSSSVRSGMFRLLEDGTLEGDARVTLSGHTGIMEANEIDETSGEERVKAFRDLMVARIPGAEVTDVRFQSADRESSMVLSFHLRAPGYANGVGRRLLLNPALFECGRPARFTSGTRRNAIDFHFPWSVRDSIVLELPAGYTLESPDVPGVYDVPGIFHYAVKVGTIDGGARVVYQREFAVDRYSFPARSYPEVRAAFDAVHERDQYKLFLRSGSSGP